MRNGTPLQNTSGAGGRQIGFLPPSRVIPCKTKNHSVGFASISAWAHLSLMI